VQKRIWLDKSNYSFTFIKTKHYYILLLQLTPFELYGLTIISTIFKFSYFKGRKENNSLREEEREIERFCVELGM